MRLSFVERQVSSPSANAPVLIMIHGRGDSPENFIHLSDGVKTPRRELALRGIHEENFGFDRGWRWFDSYVGNGDTEALAREILLATKVIAEDLETLNLRENQAQRRFVVSGFSQGGILSYALALNYPQLVSHAVPIAGLLPPQCRPTISEPASMPPIDGFHGLADPLVCPRRAAELIESLRSMQYPVSFETYEGVEHTVSASMLTKYEQVLERALRKT